VKLRNRTILDSVNFKVKEINKYLDKFNQRIELSEAKENPTDEKYRDLKWLRPLDRDNELEEHILGGDDFELFCALTGIEYGIRMERLKSESN
jgi:hypothetical protein